jgi:hypothetical protein
MILIKMNKLGIDPDKYKSYDEHAEKFSYVLINPPHDYILKAGDIVYLLKPGSNTFPAMPNESEDLSLGQQSSQQRQHDLNSPTNTTIITPNQQQQQQRNNEDPQSPKMSIDSPTTRLQEHQKFSLPMSSSHLSIDESWLELNATPAIGDEISEATTANKSKKNSIDFIASKLNLNNLKKIFLPSSGVSLQAAAENEDDMIGPLRELEKLTTSGILVSTSGGGGGDGGRCGGVVGTGKVRSKSVVSTSIPTSEKLAQMALRKKFFQATRLNNKHQDDISI